MSVMALEFTIQIGASLCFILGMIGAWDNWHYSIMGIIAGLLPLLLSYAPRFLA